MASGFLRSASSASLPYVYLNLPFPLFFSPSSPSDWILLEVFPSSMRISALKESLVCWFEDLSHQRLLTRTPLPRVLASLCSAPALPRVLPQGPAPSAVPSHLVLGCRCFDPNAVCAVWGDSLPLVLRCCPPDFGCAIPDPCSLLRLSGRFKTYHLPGVLFRRGGRGG